MGLWRSVEEQINKTQRCQRQNWWQILTRWSWQTTKAAQQQRRLSTVECQWAGRARERVRAVLWIRRKVLAVSHRLPLAMATNAKRKWEKNKKKAVVGAKKKKTAMMTIFFFAIAGFCLAHTKLLRRRHDREAWKWAHKKEMTRVTKSCSKKKKKEEEKEVGWRKVCGLGKQTLVTTSLIKQQQQQLWEKQ